MEGALDIREYLKNKFENKECHVLGFGRSNKPLAKMLLDAGAKVTVRDMNEGVLNDPYALMLRDRGVTFALGKDYLEGMSGDFIFRSPGLRHDLPAIKRAVEGGAELTGEMELFFEVCPCPILGITGSDGKTTTTTLTHLFLDTEKRKEGHRAYVGGNIGYPLLPLAFDSSWHNKK